MTARRDDDETWTDIAARLGVPWPPPPPPPWTLAMLIAELREVSFDYSDWCWANHRNAADPESRARFEWLVEMACITAATDKTLQ
jgi:hypothetical protein